MNLHPKPTVEPITILLVFIPILHVLGFCFGWLTDRTYSLQMGQATILCVVFALMAVAINKGTYRSDVRWDGLARAIVLSLCALLTWVVATQQWSSFSGGYARIGDYATLLVIVIMIVMAPTAPSCWLRLIGASIATMTVIVVVVSVAHGRLSTDDNQVFGLGAQPILGCLATPILSAWVIHLWLRRRMAYEPTSRVEWAWCVVGVFALVCYMWFAERRGPLVALVAIVAFYVCLRFWRRVPRLTVLGLSVTVATVVIYLGFQLIHHEGTGRSERYLLFRVAAEIGWSAFPWGVGPFGMLAADQSSSMSAMLWVAREKAAFHAHNELLNAWVEGGVVQVGIVTTLVLLLVKRIARCPDNQLKWPYVAMAVAVCVHAMTDNTYGIPLGMAWCGLVIGGILTLPQPPADQELLPKTIPWLAVGCGSLAVISCWPIFSMAGLSRDTAMSQRLEAMQRCRDPMFVFNELGIIANSSGADSPMKCIAVDIAVGRAGWALFVPRAAVAAAASNGDYPRYIEGLVRIAQRNPFDLDACRNILQVVQADPTLAELVPEQIKQRCAMLIGVAHVEVKDDNALADWHSASLCLAAIWFATDRNALTDRHRDQIIQLMKRYPLIPTICVAAMRVASRSDELFVQRLVEHKELAMSGIGSYQSISAALKLVSSPKQAAALFRIFESHQYYASIINRLDQRQSPGFTGRESDEMRQAWKEVVRLWSLARRDGSGFSQ